MTAKATDIETEAIDWLVRVNSPQFDDWGALAAWMALSADHARAFNELAAIDHAYAGAAPRPAAPRNPLLGVAVPGGGWRRLPGRFVGRAAAMAVLLFAAVFVLYPRATVLETRPGEMRELQLAHGVRVYLNGDTRIEYRGKDPRRVALVRGEALFDVTNGASNPFEVTAGKIVMRDLGTTFNVIHSDNVTELAVSKGRVMFDSEGSGLVLSQGEAARVIGGQGRAERFAIPADAVAGWRSGRLVYRNAAMAQIAEELARRSGVPVAVAPAAQGLRFTGTVALGPDLGTSLATIGPMLGVAPRRGKSGWVLDVAAQ